MIKIIITALGVVIVMSVLLGIREGFFDTDVEVMTFEEEEVIEEVPEVVEQDALEKAQAQLDAVNVILDEEEQKLLKEIEQLNDFKKSKEARLEQIRETRTSF